MLTIGEIRRGAESVRRRDPDAGTALDSWLARLIEVFGDRILPVDRAIAEEWGRMSVPDPLPVVDGLLAATARVRGLPWRPATSATSQARGQRSSIRSVASGRCYLAAREEQRPPGGACGWRRPPGGAGRRRDGARRGGDRARVGGQRRRGGGRELSVPRLRLRRKRRRSARLHRDGRLRRRRPDRRALRPEREPHRARAAGGLRGGDRRRRLGRERAYGLHGLSGRRRPGLRLPEAGRHPGPRGRGRAGALAADLRPERAAGDGGELGAG